MLVQIVDFGRISVKMTMFLWKIEEPRLNNIVLGKTGLIACFKKGSQPYKELLKTYEYLGDPRKQKNEPNQSLT